MMVQMRQMILDKMHITYLNKMYDENVLNKWKAEIYNGDDIFNGISVYDYMLSHLGIQICS